MTTASTPLTYEIAGSGPPIVLIHAGIADSRMWDDQFAAFAERFTVIRYDVRGFGRNVTPAETYSDRGDLLAVFDAAGVERAAIVGVSKGAMIALDFALDHPDRVTALILAAPALGGVPASAAAAEFYAAVDDLYEEGDLDGAVEMELSRWVDGPRRSSDMVDPTVREKVRVMNTENFDTGDMGKEQPLMPPAVGRLDEVEVPTLVIVGDGDVREIFQNANTLAMGIPGASQVVVMHDVAHMLTMERPDEFNRIAIEFLESATPPPSAMSSKDG